MWDGGNIALELASTTASPNNPVVINRFIRGLTLISSTQHGFYLFNVRGDVVQRASNQQNNTPPNTPTVTILHTYQYDAFGNELNYDQTNSNPFRFAGEYWDHETQTYYLRARHFNPRIGRFTQADPFWNISNMQGSNAAIMQAGNLYMYTMHNPVRFIDPLGLFALPPQPAFFPDGSRDQDQIDGARGHDPTMVLLRYIAEKNGGRVTWNQSSRTATVHMPGFDPISGISGVIVNGRMIIERSFFMDNFGLSINQASHMPYDRFRSKDSALLAWALMYHPRSTSFAQFPLGSEWGTWIYRDTDNTGLYMFGARPTQRGDAWVILPTQNHAFEPVGWIHTHPNPGYRWIVEEFSSADARVSAFFGVPGFLVAPSGALRRIDPSWSGPGGSFAIPNNSPYVSTIIDDIFGRR